MPSNLALQRLLFLIRRKSKPIGGYPTVICAYTNVVRGPPIPPAAHATCSAMPTSAITSPYDSTVEQLYNAANDVEMQVRQCFTASTGANAYDSAFAQPYQDAFPTNQRFLYIVIDTNVLIDYCGVIERFCDDTEKAQYPIMIIIPSVVLGELDGYVHYQTVRHLRS